MQRRPGAPPARRPHVKATKFAALPAFVWHSELLKAPTAAPQGSTQHVIEPSDEHSTLRKSGVQGHKRAVCDKLGATLQLGLCAVRLRVACRYLACDFQTLQGRVG